MIQSSENLVKDGQTDETDFIGRCPANVERPKIITLCQKKLGKTEMMGKKTLKNFMAPFYGWGSTVSRLQPLRGGSYFLPLTSQKFLVLILSTWEG